MNSRINTNLNGQDRNRLAVSFWLVPRKSEREPWQQLINTLASQYNTPGFVPHVTLAVISIVALHKPGVTALEFIQSRLNVFASANKPLRLPVKQTSFGTTRFQCVFAPVPNEPVTQMADQLVSSLGQSNTEATAIPSDAHLSLLYACISQAQRQTLASNINAPASTVSFDEIYAVTPAVAGADFSDPAAWTICARARLSGEITQSP